MKAARIHNFGLPDVIVIDELAVPQPSAGQVLVRVANAGVGPWDALIRQGKSIVHSPLPLTLGSDLSGTIEALGPGITEYKVGDEIYGVTNPQFIGAYAEFALASSSMIAPKPKSLTFTEAASVPVVAVTAWQMLFEYANVQAGQTVLILGANGNVGAYAVQLATQAGVHVLQQTRHSAKQTIPKLDAILDLVGGETRDRFLQNLQPNGTLVSAVSQAADPRAKFFLVEVTTTRLNRLTKLFDEGKLNSQVGTILPLTQARTAHEMLAGSPHNPGKIILQTQ